MSPQEILALSCAQLAHAIRDKRVSCVAAMEAVLARAGAVQPKLNCFIRTDDAPALEAARAADRALAAGHFIACHMSIPGSGHSKQGKFHERETYA